MVPSNYAPLLRGLKPQGGRDGPPWRLASKQLRPAIEGTETRYSVPLGAFALRAGPSNYAPLLRGLKRFSINPLAVATFRQAITPRY